MTIEKIILLLLFFLLFPLVVSAGCQKHRENRAGGIKSNCKSTPATPKAPPPPKKREKGAGE